MRLPDPYFDLRWRKAESYGTMRVSYWHKKDRQRYIITICTEQ